MMLANRIIQGDALQVLRTLPADNIDAIVTDPPYGLSFMDKDWDRGIPGVPYWAEALRVAKPGAHLLAFGGTRTYHRLACAIEDAGWEIRDCLMWLYGSGFPKSMDVSKALDKRLGEEREVVGSKSYPNMKGGNYSQGNRDYEKIDHKITMPASEAAKFWAGWGTALKPAWEPIIMARKPVDDTVAGNVLKHGVGGINIDACRLDARGVEDVQGGYSGSSVKVAGLPQPGKVYPADLGRWPANLMLDEGAATVLDEQSGIIESGKPAGVKAGGRKNAYGYFEGGIPVTGYGDKGGASRFFYVAKASPGERDDGLKGMRKNIHPTVKPISLMRYLCRLVTPRGGIVLDPFIGSGSTLLAARQEGFNYLGIELNPEYVTIANMRLNRGHKTLDTFEEKKEA